MPTTRRSFLHDGLTVASTAAGIALAGTAALAQEPVNQPPSVAFGQDASHPQLPTDAPATLTSFSLPETTRRGDMLYRKLGQTGEEVSLIGLGGFHIGIPEKVDDSIKLIRTAIDRGITFLDNCWDYHNGDSEVRMGKALQSGYRQKVFLMTKIDGRTAAAATAQINQSLERLQTDHIDLLQMHEILRLEDPDRIFAKGGAMEAVQAAKTAGKIRFIGFTGHKDPLVHLRMLEVADQHGFRFDTVQMPLNIMDAHFRSFREGVLPVLVKKQIGVLGMKTFGDHFILDHVLKNKLATPIEMLHYGMSLPTSVVITGIERQEILDQAFEAAKTWKPMTQEQMTALLAKTRTPALTGQYELFKTSNHFDGTAKNPDWLG